jgi:hypothetical protein
LWPTEKPKEFKFFDGIFEEIAPNPMVAKEAGCRSGSGQTGGLYFQSVLASNFEYQIPPNFRDIIPIGLCTLQSRLLVPVFETLMMKKVNHINFHHIFFPSPFSNILCIIQTFLLFAATFFYNKLGNEK